MALPEVLKNEIATIDKDITVPVYCGVLRSQDDTLLTRGGGRGLRIYDDIERDCHAYAVLQKRKMAVIGREWTVDPASTSRLDKRAADLVRAQLQNLSGDIPDDEVLPQVTGFDAVCLNLLDANLKGFAVGEIMWSSDGAEIVANEIRARDQRRFAFAPGNRGYRLTLKTFDNLLPGEPVPPRKFVVNSFGTKDSNPYGLGLGSRLFWPTLFKRQGITFWLTFIDKFAAPTAIGKYPTGSTPDDQTKLLNALGAIASEAGVIIPEGMVIELLEAARSGSVDCYEKLARYMDEQISEAVLGETLSTNLGSGGGSLAAAKTHNEVRLELVKADADLLCGCLNGTLIKWITTLNVPGAKPPKVWRDCAPEDDLKTKAERDGILSKDVGVKFTQVYLQREYGFEEGDIESIGAPAPGSDKGLINTKISDAAFAELAPQPASTDQTMEDLTAAASLRYTDLLMTSIKEILDKAKNLQEAREMLTNEGMDISIANLAGFIAEMNMKSMMVGRLEAAQEP
jgi:phage gp29-like protein